MLMGGVGRESITIGAAGEALAEFYLWQFCKNVMRSNGAASYDLVAEHSGNLWRVQVKTSRYTTHGKGNCRYRYEFKRRFKESKRNKTTGYEKVDWKLYDSSDCDIYGLVAFEIKRVYFMPVECGEKVMSFDKRTFDVQGLEQISFEAAIKRSKPAIGTSGDN